MKEVRILTIDNRGRIVIPNIIRKSIGLTINSQLMMVSDSEKKEIKITPVGLGKESRPIQYRITMEDVPGSLAKIATTFGDLGVSLIYGESMTLEKNKTAVWTVIGPSPTDIELEDLKEILLSKGEAIEVEITPLE